MKILKQKNHGLPGLGINGQPGQTGQKAQSVYMGFINDFFYTDDISIGTFIYTAKRTNNSYINEILYRVAVDEVKSVDPSNVFSKVIENASIDSSSYVNCHTLYFTGNRLLNADINNGIVNSNNIYNEEIDLTGDYISMTFMLNTAAKNNMDIANSSTRIKQFIYENDASVQVKMNEKEHKFSSNDDISDLYNIINNVTYYSFPNEARAMINGSINDRSGMDIYIPYDFNDAIYDTSIIGGMAAENGILLKSPRFDDIFYTYYPDGTSINYVKPEIENNFVYITDANNAYAQLYPITDNTSIDASVATKLKDADISKQYQFINDENKWPYLYKSSFRDNDTFYTEKDLKDVEGKSFYGVATPWLFLNKGTDNVRINDSSLLSLQNIPQAYIDSYKNANSYGSVILNSNNGLYVYYTLNDGDQIIKIPSTLKSEYVVGDVLYFYTNQYDYNNIDSPYFQNLLYMVVLTEDLMGCTPTQLVSAAQLTSPLEIKFFSKNENRLSSYNNVAVLLNDTSNNTQTKLSNRSLVSIADNYTNAPVILCSSSKNNINTFTAFDSSNDSDSISLYGKINEDNKFNIACSSTNSIIKSNSLCITNNITEETNVELYNYIYNTNIKLYNNDFVRPLLDLNYYFDETTMASIFLYDISADDYFYNVENLSDYLYGCDIYNSKMEKINTIISNSKNLEISLVPTINNDTYYFQMFASCGSSLKYYSKITKLSLVYNIFKYYNNIRDIILPNKESSGKYWHQNIQKNNTVNQRFEITSFKLEILGENQNILKDKISGNIFFDLSDITANEIVNASLSIYPVNSSIVIDDIIFNRNLEKDWFRILYDSARSDASVFNINLSSNLPAYDGSSFNNINEFVYSGSTGGYESNLFKNLYDNPDFIIPESKQRSILVTTKYHYIDNENEKFYENFEVVQPGFKDTRSVPQIELNTHTKIEELSSYNSIKNGVLTNQFVTYVDINIKDFKKQWGQFVNDDVSIFMDISIRNTDYDLNWQYENIVENLTERRTFRAILENIDSNVNHLNNYVKITSVAFETTDNLLNKNTTSYINTSGNLISGGEFNVSDKYALCSLPTISDNDYIDPSNGYILFDSSVLNIMKSPQIMYAGIQDNILLELKNIPVCEDISTIKLKLMVEMGNPLLSNLYLRFIVDSIRIHVNGTTFYTAIVDNQNTYLSTTSTDVDGTKSIVRLNYRYISDPIDVTFNPLSYTVCSNDIEKTYTDIYGNIHKYGIKDQIKKELKFFNSSIYEENPFNYSKEKIRTNQYYPFNNLYIKKSYIQDNIKQISVYPISLWDTIKYADCSTLSLSIDASLKTHNVLDFVEGNKYLGIVYHSNIMQPRIENDQYIFHYNERKYLRSKYDQKNNNMPVFAYDSQSIELRDDDLINSMDKWNDYYASSIKYNDAKTYQGVLSLYGNGYTQILDTDIKEVSFYKNKITKASPINPNFIVESSGQYNKKNINILETSGSYLYNNSKNILVNKVLTLKKVKELNDVSINLYKGINEVDIEPMKLDQPNNKEYLRGLLYDINWEFPYYNNINIYPYRIVSPFDNLLNNTSSNIPNIYNEYYNTLIDTDNSPYGTNMIPYNLLFDLNPRIAYNYENNGVNVLMLRRPSIGIDTDNIDTSIDFKEKYEFSNQLFDLIGGIEKLKRPYIVK